MLRVLRGIRNAMLTVSIILSIAAIFVIDGIDLRTEAALVCTVVVFWLSFKVIDTVQKFALKDMKARNRVRKAAYSKPYADDKRDFDRAA